MEPLIVAIFYSIGLCAALWGGLRNATGVFLLYFTLGGMLPYFAALEAGRYETFLGFYLDTENFETAAIFLSLAFALTMISSVIRLAPRANPQTVLFIREGRLVQFALFSLFCFLAYLALSIAFAGSLQNALIASYARVRTNSSLANLRSVFFWGAVVFSTFAFFGLKFNIVSKRVKVIVMLSVLGSLCLSLVDGGRAILILFVLSLFMKEILNARKITLLLFSLVGSLAISVLSYFMLSWRYAAQGAEITSENSLSLSGAFTGLAFIDHFQLSIEYAKELGFDYGLSYLNAAISFVPRALFPDKATPLAAQVRGYLYGDETGGIPPGLFGESYIAYGVIGVVAVALLYGQALFFVAKLSTAAAKLDCPVRYATAGIIVPLIGFTLVRGGLDIGVLRVGLPFFWIFIATTLSTKRRQHEIT
ncbi:hypothetical protein CEW89_11520 [Celeribacter ethanolicus]|uniref:Oligosaccharide repeat unit polymerase n=1 Tax=Celeribacter ethanolicus TaxID=1758178 RepID=A0A291GD69_9RHOB|nr:O-antigen polymerase [Celeribacter ethanolicus]ATG48145.1 hypothetical protein CEW89_11520 [Celeribacter ethanolicus]